MFGYDTFVLDDNQYGDSFYSNMADSVQIKKTLPVQQMQAPQQTQPAQIMQVTQPQQMPTMSSFSSRHDVSDYMYMQEIEKLRFQIIIFFILLMASVVIMVTQRLTINTMQQLMHFMKPEIKLSSI